MPSTYAAASPGSMRPPGMGYSVMCTCECPHDNDYHNLLVQMYTAEIPGVMNEIRNLATRVLAIETTPLPAPVSIPVPTVRVKASLPHADQVRARDLTIDDIGKVIRVYPDPDDTDYSITGILKGVDARTYSPGDDPSKWEIKVALLIRRKTKDTNDTIQFKAGDLVEIQEKPEDEESEA